jgi:hypothetical protein
VIYKIQAIVNRPSSPNSTLSKLPTLVAQLKGEIGNHLSVIAYAEGVQLWPREQYGIDTLMMRNQDSRNRVGTPPKRRPFDFSEANTREFDKRQREQQEWIRHPQHYASKMV